MGAINALREKNIKVPEEVDVIGFDNIYSSSISYPKLTTVGVPMYDMICRYENANKNHKQ